MKLAEAAADPARVDFRPARVVTLPVSAFCEAWTKRPRGPFQVGLRRLSADEYLFAKGEAEKLAATLLPDVDRGDSDWLEAYEIIYFHQILACALTDPQDARKPLWEPARGGAQDAGSWLLRMPKVDSLGDLLIKVRNPSEVIAATRFTAEGFGRLFDEYTALRVTNSPLWPEAADGPLQDLGAMLADGALLAELECGARPGEPAIAVEARHHLAAEVRRHLGFVIDMIDRGLAGPEAPTQAP